MAVNFRKRNWQKLGTSEIVGEGALEFPSLTVLPARDKSAAGWSRWVGHEEGVGRRAVGEKRKPIGQSGRILEDVNLVASAAEEELKLISWKPVRDAVVIGTVDVLLARALMDNSVIGLTTDLCSVVFIGKFFSPQMDADRRRWETGSVEPSRLSFLICVHPRSSAVEFFHSWFKTERCSGPVPASAAAGFPTSPAIAGLVRLTPGTR